MSEDIKDAKKLYEIGFNIISSISTEKISDEIAAIKKILTNHGAEIVKEGEAKLISLAYTMTKKIKEANQKFDKAYFSWVKFNSTAADVEAIKAELDKSETILRYLLIKTTDNFEHSTNKIQREKEEKAKTAKLVTEKNRSDEISESDETPNQNEEAEEIAESTEKDVDEAIDELVK